MPLWIGILIGCAALFVLASALFRFHYNLDWSGGTAWSALLEYGFPGFTKTLRYPSPVDSQSPNDPSASSGPSNLPATPGLAPLPGQAGFMRLPHLFRLNRNRLRRALFLLVTDGKLWIALLRFCPRLLRGTLLLLNPEVDCAIGHADPAVLGRWAGYWYAGKMFPTRRIQVHFRFQDQKFSLRLCARGAFSALRLCGVVLCALATFPWLLLLSRAWHGWRHFQLKGWRAFVYARIQNFSRASPASI
jgi:hypothetical protein